MSIGISSIFKGFLKALFSCCICSHFRSSCCDDDALMQVEYERKTFNSELDVKCGCCFLKKRSWRNSVHPMTAETP